MKPTSSDLTGKLLIAMPGMDDPRFEQSVIYICQHSDEGALGLVVNKPALELKFPDLLRQMGLSAPEGMRDIRVHFGGPVEMGRGFVLHSADYESGGGRLRVDDKTAMTATINVLEDIAEGRGPRQSMLALGYCGWGPGQLEGEFARNGWLTCDPRDDILFGRANEFKWTAALKIMGIDPLMLSSVQGRA